MDSPDLNPSFALTSRYQNERHFYYVPTHLPNLIFSFHTDRNEKPKFMVEWIDQFSIHQHREITKLGHRVIKEFSLEAALYLRQRGYTADTSPLSAKHLPNYKLKLTTHYNSLNSLNEASVYCQHIDQKRNPSKSVEISKYVSLIVQAKRGWKSEYWNPVIFIRIKPTNYRHPSDLTSLRFATIEKLNNGWGKVIRRYETIHSDKAPEKPCMDLVKKKYQECEEVCRKRNQALEADLIEV